MSIDRTVNVHVSYVQMKVWWVIYRYVQYWGVLCVVQVGYGLGQKTVPVSGCFMIKVIYTLLEWIIHKVLTMSPVSRTLSRLVTTKEPTRKEEMGHFQENKVLQKKSSIKDSV